VASGVGEDGVSIVLAHGFGCVEVIRIKDRSCADVGDVIELGYD